MRSESFKPDASYEIRSQFTHTQSRINAIRHENQAAVTPTSSFLQTEKRLLATDLGVSLAMDVSQNYSFMFLCTFRSKDNLLLEKQGLPTHTQNFTITEWKT